MSVQFVDEFASFSMIPLKEVPVVTGSPAITKTQPLGGKLTGGVKRNKGWNVLINVKSETSPVEVKMWRKGDQFCYEFMGKWYYV